MPGKALSVSPRRLTLALAACFTAGTVLALPVGPQVVAGSAAITQAGNALTVANSPGAILHWQTFNIGANERVRFEQASASSTVLNRVIANDPSVILGQLSSNGRVWLINPAGILVGPGARIDTAAFVASTLNIANADFLANKLKFDGLGGTGNVVNQGTITTPLGGSVYLIGSQVGNDGIITTPKGETILAAGQKVELIDTAIPGVKVEITGQEGNVTNLGRITAEAGRIGIAGALIKNAGTLNASSVEREGGRIFLKAASVQHSGLIDASSQDGSGGSIDLKGAVIAAGGPINADGATGGSVSLQATGLLSLAEPVSAKGTAGAGGNIRYSAGKLIETGTGSSDASGTTDGGTISVQVGGTLMTSGTYTATGGSGQGGRIDLTAADLRLLSTQIDASGNTQGGLVRVGGAYQGGRNDEADPARRGSFLERWGALPALANAGETLVNDGVRIDVSAKVGAGGTAIIWSDSRSTFLGHLDATGRTMGGGVEISSKEQLRYVDLKFVAIGQGGHLLLDPKNIVIGTAEDASSWSYAGILRPMLGAAPEQGKSLDTRQFKTTANIDISGLADGDSFGSAVALNAAGDRLAVGAPGDGGADNDAVASGAVRLFSFSDTRFSGGTLQATLGKGYTGGKNVNVAGLGDHDNFGSAVALNATGDRLAVGTPGDGNTLSSEGPAGSGAVHLFSFSDTSFTGGTLQATLGMGHTVNVTGLTPGDAFGSAVALNAAGDRLAVGASGDDGADDSTASSGAVYLFSFTNNTPFAGGTLQTTLGKGYGVNVAGLKEFDNFGSAVALNATGDRLAVGAYGDDGAGNDANESGAVHLFSFSDSNFSGGTLQATLGKGYTDGKNVNVAALEAQDRFGSAVALNAAGDRLAVGAKGDAGASDDTYNSGAVRLFSFSGSSFTSGTLEATLGKGYTGTKDVDVAGLAAFDNFGSAVALNATGNLLAVGASGRGSNSSNTGAVHLFSFSDTSFTGGTLLSTIGKGYTPYTLGESDYFGSAVALNAAGNRLAVGAPGDAGADNDAGDSGAVHLFSFSDANFSNGTLQATLGKGYTGGKNVNVAGLEAGDYFGAAVALNAAGDRLAVGTPYDAGADNTAGDSGAVRLFSFSDANFSNGTLQATLGKGYSGGKNVNVAGLDAGDYFGAAVALNAAGDRLAVGAPYDAGADNSAADSGAVRLFSFSDASFTGGTLQATLGKGYAGGKNMDVAGLEAGDAFGTAVALNAAGDRLAVGAPYDDGMGNDLENSGAVHLFSFSDTNFSNGTLDATLGTFYTGGKNVDVAGLDVYDRFGSAVALNAAGDRLAVGAPYDASADNSAVDAGAVYLFGFSDTGFTGGALQATLGKGYTGGKNVNMAELDAYDYFGSAVALNAVGDRLAVGVPFDDGTVNSVSDFGAVHLFSFSDTYFSGGTQLATIGAVAPPAIFGAAVALNAAGDRLAVGAPGDAGVGNDAADSGAVHLFSFSDTHFSGGTLQATLGKGYSGGKNVDVAGLDAYDRFGTAVALNAAGDRLAVGAPIDDSADNNAINYGAVRLFSFSDTNFSNGTLQATLGKGYSGGKNVDVAGLEAGDAFGTAVALNAAGDRLAVGAWADAGAGNDVIDSGAVYLFSFSDTNFSNGTLQATLGKGYSGGKNVNVVGLDMYDRFGTAVALNAAGDRLAVGALYDNGADNTATDAGAVYLFSFSDTNFSNGTLQATLGKGYSGGKNVNVAGLDAGDAFGTAVALNAAGDRLAVGAPYDDGMSNGTEDAGAVYLFKFGDTHFSGGTLETTLGKNYSGGKDVDVVGLDQNDRFGAAVAFNAAGDRLAVGAEGDDGADNVVPGSGAVHLFALGATGSGRNFAELGSQTSYVSASQLITALSAGVSVILQASNDITLNNAVLVSNPGGNGGDLTLQAGRSILLNANIGTDNGNFVAIANERRANGVVDADREAGAANIAMAAGTSINAGTGSIVLAISDGAGLTNSTPGTVSLTTLAANRWLVYAPNPGSVFKNGITSDFRQYNTGYGGTIDTAAGKGFIYASSPGTLTVDTALAAGTASHVYGNTPTAGFGYSLSGFADAEDNASNIGLGGTAIFNAPLAASNAADYSVAYTNGLSNTRGYAFAAGSGVAYTVSKRTLVGSFVGGGSIYGDLLSPASFSFTNIVGSDDVDAAAVVIDTAGLLSSSGHLRAGTHAAIQSVGQTLSGASKNNYSFAGATTSYTVAQRSLTATAHNTTRIYGDNNPGLTGILAGFVYGEDSSVLITAPSYSTSASQTSNVGSYAIVGAGGTAQNYSFNYVDGTLAITPRPLTISVGGSKVYDRSAVLSAPTFSLGNLVNGDVLTPSGTASFADWNAGSGKALTATDLVLTGAKAGNYTWNTSASGTGSIAQLASVTWIGGSKGVWSDAANWFGGALPDNNNVAEVIISATAAGPSGITITNPYALDLGNTAITANIGSLTLETVGGLTTGSGLIRTPYGRLSLVTHSPMIIGSGGLQAASGITLEATTAEAGSTITLNGPVRTDSGNMMLTAYGNVMQNADISASNVTVRSRQGNIIVASSASTIAGRSGIRYLAPQGTVSSNAGNFVGATPVITSVSGTTGESPTVPTTEVTQQLAVVLERVADTAAPVAAAPETPVSSSEAPVLPGSPATGAPRLLATLGQSIGGGDGQFGSQSAGEGHTPAAAREEPPARTERSDRPDEKKEEKKDDKKMTKEDGGDGKKPTLRATQKKLAQCS